MILPKLNLKITYFIFLYVLQCSSNRDETNKCCPRAEWEGHMHVSLGSELNYFKMLMYTNGTIHIAYSVPLQKIFMGINVVQNISYLPQGEAFNVTRVYDYGNGIMYEVATTDYNCTKTQIPLNCTKQCIPSDAKLLTKGALGDDGLATVSTYLFKIPSVGLDFHVRATVHETGSQSICDPVHVVYATDVEADIGGTMYSLDIFDIGPIKSTDIFKLPKQCLK